MLKIRVIPCLDVDAGRVVKGVRFVDLKDAGDPVESALFYTNAGADELCFLDISATVEGRKTMLHIVEDVACCCSIPLMVGGGITSLENMEDLFRSGADKIALNSITITNPDLVRNAADCFGSQAIVLSVDVRKNAEGVPMVYTHGGRKNTNINAQEHICRMVDLGAGEVLLTSMEHDGTKKGFDVTFLKNITDRVSVPIIASGGAGSPSDFCDAVTNGGAHAVLAASIFHYREHTILDVKKAMAKNGILMRF